MDAPEVEPVHAHAEDHSSTGGRRGLLNALLPIAALVASAASIAIAVHHGHTMEKLVASNSYPNLDIENGNRIDLGDGAGARPVIYVSVTNTGVGPARVRSVEMTIDGRPVRGLTDLLAACCGGGAAGHYFFSGDVRGRLVPPGKSIQLFAWPRPESDDAWSKLEKSRDRITLKTCYCSVFDECYVADSSRREPDRVDSCPTVGMPFDGT